MRVDGIVFNQQDTQAIAAILSAWAIPQLFDRLREKQHVSFEKTPDQRGLAQRFQKVANACIEQGAVIATFFRLQEQPDTEMSWVTRKAVSQPKLQLFGKGRINDQIPRGSIR
jgi:hypothetical protein